MGCAHAPRVVHVREAGQVAEHPLEPLTRDEIQVAFVTLLAHFRADPALPKEALRFPLVALAEPEKAFVLGWSKGQPFVRRAEVHVLHHPSNRTWVAQIDLSARRLLRLDAQPAGTQAAATGDEFRIAAGLVRAYAPWQQALRTRGVNAEYAYIDVWAPGDIPLPDEVAAALPFGHETRLLRCLTFDRGAPAAAQDPRAPQNPYDRAVEGVVVTVDMNAGRVVHMTDTLVRPVIDERGNAARARPLKPLVVQQARGSDVRLEGRLVRWHNWQFYVGFHPREGLVLYDVRVAEGGVLRSVAYRLALSEIYVPYGLADPNWTWRSAFDLGEYNAGSLAQPLEVDRDVPENTTFFDALLASDVGVSAAGGGNAVPAAIALYERDAGILWTRTDPTTFQRDTRFARELVATWNCWIGNYIYGFDWVFRLDGTIAVEVKLTGTTLNRGADAQPEVSAPKVGKDARGVLVAAPHHQHFFSFRLDLDVDGPASDVMEMEVTSVPSASFLGAFDAAMTYLVREGGRDVNPLTARHWHVESARVRNAYGKPTSYALEPGALALPYPRSEDPARVRAQFARHQLWVTRYREGELYAAGPFPSQAKREDGVARYAGDEESLEHQDVVLWHTIGLTHLARPEDYPVMPTESIGFKLVPRGFFARNPALDVADQGARQQ